MYPLGAAIAGTLVVSRIYLSLVVTLALLVGCDAGPAPNAGAKPGASEYDNYSNYGTVDFKDEAPANTTTTEDLSSLQFTDPSGKPVDLKQYHGQKNVVLVFTRGLTSTLDPQAKGAAGGICLYCATQTSRIAANYDEFQKRDAEVIAVFPVVKPKDAARLTDFEKAIKDAATTPGGEKAAFPIVLDVELKAVDHLGIRRDLSKPSTFILDKDGKVRYAYVGANLADRPSVRAMLAQLDQIIGPQ